MKRFAKNLPKSLPCGFPGSIPLSLHQSIHLWMGALYVPSVDRRQLLVTSIFSSEDQSWTRCFHIQFSTLGDQDDPPLGEAVASSIRTSSSFSMIIGGSLLLLFKSDIQNVLSHLGATINTCPLHLFKWAKTGYQAGWWVHLSQFAFPWTTECVYKVSAPISRVSGYIALDYC